MDPQSSPTPSENPNPEQPPVSENPTPEAPAPEAPATDMPAAETPADTSAAPVSSESTAPVAALPASTGGKGFTYLALLLAVLVAPVGLVMSLVALSKARKNGQSASLPLFGIIISLLVIAGLAYALVTLLPTWQ